jgi:hypothetical protein
MVAAGISVGTRRAEEEEDHQHDDDDRLDQRLRHIRQRLADEHRLVVADLQHRAVRHAVPQPPHRLRDAGGDLQRIGIRPAVDRDRHGVAPSARKAVR